VARREDAKAKARLDHIVGIIVVVGIGVSIVATPLGSDPKVQRSEQSLRPVLARRGPSQRRFEGLSTGRASPEGVLRDLFGKRANLGRATRGTRGSGRRFR
jgi:hypothetical protein